jgi:hypothetical protein
VPSNVFRVGLRGSDALEVRLKVMETEASIAKEGFWSGKHGGEDGHLFRLETRVAELADKLDPVGVAALGAVSRRDVRVRGTGTPRPSRFSCPCLHSHGLGVPNVHRWMLRARVRASLRGVCVFVGAHPLRLCLAHCCASLTVFPPADPG